MLEIHVQRGLYYAFCKGRVSVYKLLIGKSGYKNCINSA